MSARTLDGDNSPSFSVVSDTGPLVSIPTWVFDSDISAQAIRVYGNHLRIADKYGGAHHCKRATILRVSRCSESTLDRCHKELVGIGALEIVHQTTDVGDPAPNVYKAYRTHPSERSPNARSGWRQNDARGGVKNDAQVVLKTKYVSKTSRTRETATASATSGTLSEPPSRVRGDDRSGELVAPVTRAEPDASHEKQQPKDPPRVPLYADVNPIVHGNQLEPLADEYIAVGLAEIRRLRAAQYHPTVIDPKQAAS